MREIAAGVTLIRNDTKQARGPNLALSLRFDYSIES